MCISVYAVTPTLRHQAPLREAQPYGIVIGRKHHLSNICALMKNVYVLVLPEKYDPHCRGGISRNDEPYGLQLLGDHKPSLFVCDHHARRHVWMYWP